MIHFFMHTLSLRFGFAKALRVFSLLLTYLSLYLFVYSPSEIQAAEWHSYTYTDRYRRVALLGDDLYVLKSGTLFRGKAGDWEVNEQLSRESGLSGTEIFDVAFSDHANRLAVAYSDGSIDIIRPDRGVTTISDIANSPMMGIDKTLVSLHEQEGHLYVITAYGFFIVDLQQEVILQNFNLGLTPVCAWGYNGRWFYSTSQGIFNCSMSDNPFRPDAWSCNDTHPITDVLVFTRGGVSQCWLLANNRCIRRFTPGNYNSVRCSDYNVYDFKRAGRYVLASTKDSLYVYDASLGIAPASYEKSLLGQINTCSSTVFRSPTDVCSLADDGQSLLFLTSTTGIYADSITIAPAEARNGVATLHPIHDTHLTINAQQQNADLNKVVVCSDGQVGFSYVPGLSLGYGKILNVNGMLTTQKNQQWTNYSNLANGTALCTHNRLCGITGFAADPTYADRYWYSTLEDGIVCINKGKFLRSYDYKNTGNSGLARVASPSLTRVGGITFCPNGDMWCTNEGVTELLVVRQNNGQWKRFRIYGLESSYGFSYICHTQRNGRHQVWATQNMNHQATNVLCYDYGTDISNTQDDRSTFFRQLIPFTDGVQQPAFIPFYGRGVYESPLGAIWLLNTSGLYSIDEPDSVFTHPGEVRTILADVIPSGMAIDSHDHVWISTEGDGIYLLTADGRRIITHLTTDNSVLPSNEVLSIEIDKNNNQLWIVTRGNLSSYSYDPKDYDDASEYVTTAYCWPAKVQVTQLGEDNNTPNPIETPLNDNSLTALTVFNLCENSSVSLCNENGRILLQDTAIGGLFHIDTTHLPVGTYLIVGTDTRGNTGELCSFVVEP